MMWDGFGDESDAKLIEQRGIDFAPSEDFIQTLNAAGASEAFLNVLRAAKLPRRPATGRTLLLPAFAYKISEEQGFLALPHHTATTASQRGQRGNSELRFSISDLQNGDS